MLHHEAIRKFVVARDSDYFRLAESIAEDEWQLEIVRKLRAGLYCPWAEVHTNAANEVDSVTYHEDLKESFDRLARNLSAAGIDIARYETDRDEEYGRHYRLVPADYAQNVPPHTAWEFYTGEDAADAAAARAERREWSDRP
jgi:hypothetical protein